MVGLGGNHELESIVIEDARSGELTELETRASSSSSVPRRTPTGSWVSWRPTTGFLLTGADIQGEDLTEWGDGRPLFLETSRPGVFAAGDVRSGSIKRVASAVGEGSMAVRLIHQRLTDL